MKLSFFKLRGLRGRILALLLVPIFFMCGICAVVLYQISNLTRDLSYVLTDTVPALTGSKKLQLEVTRIEGLIWGIQLHKDKDDELASHISQLDSSIGRFDNSLERYMELNIGEVAGKIREKIVPDWNMAKPSLAEIVKMAEEKKVDEIAKYFEEKAKASLHNIKENIQNVELNNADVIEVEKEKSSKTASLANWITGSAASAGIIFSLLISFFMINRIAKKFTELSELLQRESDSTRSGASHMAASSESLAQSATETASAVQEISSAVEEIRGMIERSAQNAARSLESSQTNFKSVQTGRSQLETVQHSFGEIHNATEKMVEVVENNNKKIDGIMKVIQEISAKTAVINDIVFQTKLLSFNASVEAARAGEHGKGFAIVAQEVGNLARNSGTAALEISELLEKSNKEVAEILTQSKRDIGIATESTLERLKASQESLKESLVTLDQISGQSEEINRLVQDISQASSEQTRGVSEIASSIRQINESTSLNMQNGQEISGNASSILEQVENVNGVIKELQVVVQGAA